MRTPGRSFPCFVRVPVDDVVDGIAVQAARVQKHNGLRRSAVAGDGLPASHEIPNEPSDRHACGIDAVRELRIAAGSRDAPPRLALQHGDDALRREACARRPREHAERAAVHGDALDVDDIESVPGKKRGESGEREVAEVFVVDRVELQPVDEFAKVGNLDRYDAAIARKGAQALDETVKVGDVGKHIVRDHEVGRTALGDEHPGEFGVEKLVHRLDPALACRPRDVPRRLNAEHGDTGVGEELQQVAVVTRRLDDEGALGEPETIPHLPRECPRMRDERLGERGEVWILAEERLRRYRLCDLDERAARAAHDVERKAVLGRIGLVHERVRERHLAERENGLKDRRATRTALGNPRHPRSSCS